MGIVDEDGSVASRILDQFGADAATVRNEVLRTLSGHGAAAGETRVLDDVEMTSPQLAQEVVDEISRLAAEKERLIEQQALDDAARIRDRELSLRRPAAALVRAWNRRGETGE